MADYSGWPTTSDVQDRLDAIGVSPRVSNRLGPAYWQRQIDSVTAEITRRTHRQFVAATATRYFDGSGTGAQEIDEIVTLTSVGLVGFIASSTLAMTNVYLRQDNTFPKTIIEIYQGGLPAVMSVYLDRFPQGRQNIEVVGNWGYAATIPQDLWEAVAAECAGRGAAEALFTSTGRLKSWKEADVQEEYALQLPGEAAGWHDRFESLVKLYTRNVDRNLRRWKAAML